MGGFKNKKLKNLLADGIIEEIIDKILDCCKIMIEDCVKNGNKIRNDEGEIRDYLLENYLDNNLVRRKIGLTKFLFQTEVREKKPGIHKYGYVDIKILIYPNSFEDTEAYFVIECKRIDGTSALNNKYISDGVCRFVSPTAYYTTYRNRNIMFGFVVKNIDITNNVKKINLIQKSRTELTITEGLIRRLGNIYISKYKYDTKDIMLYHIFHDFSVIISI